MENDLTKGRPLTQDEKGQLHGGFRLQKITFRTQFFSDNGNCKGGGLWDDNVNCNRCSACDQHKGMDNGDSDEDSDPDPNPNPGDGGN